MAQQQQHLQSTRVEPYATEHAHGTNSAGTNDDLARALAESTRAAAQPNNDDDERLRLAMALSQSEASSQPVATAAAATTNFSELREATRASEQAFLAQRHSMLDEVLGVLRACSPILASYVDANCGIFIDGTEVPRDAGEVELEIFQDFRRTVDTLLTDLLSEVGLGLDEVARTLQLAREEPPESDSGRRTLVEHLLAVESFAAFRRLMAQRNEAIHREARAAMPGPSVGGSGRADAGPAAGRPPLGATSFIGRAELEEGGGFATVNETEGGGGSGGGVARTQDTVEFLRVDRERDLPRSRLAEALAGASRM